MSLARTTRVALLGGLVACLPGIAAAQFDAPSVTPRDAPRNAPASDDACMRRLTDKEMEILRMLTRGMTNKAIGKALFISNKTVSSYKTRIMNKLGAESLVDLVDFARRCRLVP